MYRVEAPRADFALLLYLACVTAVVGIFALAFYGLMQPTVIPNAGVAGYKAPGPAALFLNKAEAPSEAMERAAVAAAQADNKKQGLEPLRAFASAESTQANAGRSNTAMPSDPQDSKQPKKARPKRVVRQDTYGDPWRSSWNSPWQSWEGRRGNYRSGHPFGGRPAWAFR